MKKKLPEYEAKRDFTRTPEPPPGAVTPSAVPTFMIHKHHATRLHYDLRLEIDGALASWAIPKGPSYAPAVKRLAVQTEDHPLEYGRFEGRIPDGEYGAGDSLIWDRGVFETVPPGQAKAQRDKGHLHLVFAGEKLKGAWHLVRTRGPSGTKSSWIFFKAKDADADPTRDIVVEAPNSVLSGRAATRGPVSRARLATKATPEALLERLFPPMLATLAEAPPADESQWIAEVKYDGYRALAALARPKVAMWTRNQLDLTARFPHLAHALARILVGEAVVDGEIVALDGNGRPRFQLLQEGSGEARLYAFDLLWLDGEDLRQRPLEQRRDLLQSLFSSVPAALAVAERVPGSLAEAMKVVANRGLEGLIVKRKHSTYTGKRSSDWLKLKVWNTEEVAIIGYLPMKNHDKLVGALLAAVAEKGELRFAGRIGTGFSTKQRRELWQLLEKDRLDAPPCAVPRTPLATWVTPRHIATVQFSEWTNDRVMRQPSFVGLREDLARISQQPSTAGADSDTSSRRSPSDRLRRTASTTQRHSGPSIANLHPSSPPRYEVGEKCGLAPEKKVKLTNPDKVLYPADGITKRDVADYYQAVSGPLLRALAERPLALEHWPNGVDKPSFYRQSITDKDREPWMHIVATPTSTKRGTAEHLVADSEEALAWLAQRATLAVHMWSSRERSLGEPDWVVFDLDPGEGNGIEQTIEVALALKGLFDQLSLPSLPKTTGKRGLHVLVPLLRGHTHDDALAFAQKIGAAITHALPQATMERSIARRKGRLYLDCLQNGYGKTIVAPYSPRPLAGGAVSAPLRWSEVKKGLDARQFTMKTMPGRLGKLGDLFGPALAAGARLPRLR